MRTPIRRRGTRPDGGFTLIEVLIALTILAVGLLAIAAMQLHAMRFGRSGRHTTQAAVIARNQMEQLQATDWAGLAPTGGWTVPINQSTQVQAPGGPEIEQTYAVRWRIADLIVDRTRSLDVQVQWNEPQRPNRALTISSVRHQPDS